MLKQLQKESMRFAICLTDFDILSTYWRISCWHIKRRMLIFL